MDESDDRHYPINVASRMSGLTTHVIRAWERRYQAVTPRRTASNRRLYTSADVERLRLLHEATQLGHNISQIAPLEIGAIRRLVEEDEDYRTDTPNASVSSGPPAAVSDNGNGVAARQHNGHPDSAALADTFLRACRAAIGRMDAAGIESAFLNAHRSLGLNRCLDDIVVPLLDWVGEAWRTGEVRVAQEHLTTSVVRQFVCTLRSRYTADPAAPAILVTTLPGQSHDIGPLMVSVVAAAEGWRVVYLGTDLPAEEVAGAAETTGAQVIALGITHPPDDPQLDRELYMLYRYLRGERTLLVGGRAAPSYERTLKLVGARVLDDLAGLRATLSELREHPAVTLDGPANTESGGIEE